MYGNNCFCTGCYGLLNQVFIHIQGIGADINEFRNAAAQDKSIRSGDKRIAGQNDLITGVDIAQDRCHF